MTANGKNERIVHRVRINAVVRFKTTDQGGRNGPTPPDELRCMIDLPAGLFDCRVVLAATGSVYPGQTFIAPIDVLAWEDIRQHLGDGTRFGLTDGRDFATGEVLGIVEFREG